MVGLRVFDVRQLWVVKPVWLSYHISSQHINIHFHACPECPAGAFSEEPQQKLIGTKHACICCVHTHTHTHTHIYHHWHTLICSTSDMFNECVLCLFIHSHEHPLSHIYTYIHTIYIFFLCDLHTHSPPHNPLVATVPQGHMATKTGI